MAIIFDGHNDSLTKPDHDRFVSGRDGGHLDLPRMREAGMRGGIFAIFIRNPETADYRPAASNRPGGAGPAPELDHGFAAAASSAAAGRLLALERAGEMRVARTIADIDAAAEGGPPVAVLHLEGAEAIDPGLEALVFWHASGLRSLGPVWSRPNAFGSGVRFRFPSSPDMGPGLTDAGQNLVRRCAELGIVFDLAHMNEAGFWDAAKLEAAPLVVSHAGVHAICANSRNLTDAQIDAVGATGGLIGIVFAPAFLRPDGKNDGAGMGLTEIAQHVRYVADRIGVPHVALGSDFDGTNVPEALGDVTGLPALLEEFEAAGFTEAEVEQIAWHNWRRTLASCWNAS
jgi:membrane dipeptidase